MVTQEMLSIQQLDTQIILVSDEKDNFINYPLHFALCAMRLPAGQPQKKGYAGVADGW